MKKTKERGGGMKPNIVFVMSDQQRRNSMGIYGNRYVHTPHLDAVAQSATVYDHCYCNAPVCTPSRACTLTGKTLTGHGVYNLFDIMPRNEKLLSYYLKELGYDTALVGKLHVSGTEFEAYERNPGDGFDIYELCHEPSIYLDGPLNAYAKWLGENFPDELEALKKEGRQRKFRRAETHFSTWVSERSAEIIRNRDKNKPLYLQVGYFDPHNPYDHYPKACDDLLHEEYYEAPLQDDSVLPEAMQLERKYHSPKALGAQSKEEGVRNMRRGYYAGVSFLDQQVQKIIQALKDEGIYDNTLFIYTSDHGDMLGDHDLYSKGAMFYEHGVNVPLIVKFPFQTEGTRSDRLVQLNDLFATMYTAAGGDENFRFESLPLQGERERNIAVTEYRACGKFDIEGFPHPLHGTMVRNKEWKLCLFHDTNEAQLFHLTEDPNELNNLYGRAETAAITQELMNQYLQLTAWRDRQYNMSRGGLSAMPAFAYLHKK